MANEERDIININSITKDGYVIKLSTYTKEKIDYLVENTINEDAVREIVDESIANVSTLQLGITETTAYRGDLGAALRKDVDSLKSGATPVTKAISDASGNNIVNTYATKAELENLDHSTYIKFDKILESGIDYKNIILSNDVGYIAFVPKTTVTAEESSTQTEAHVGDKITTTKSDWSGTYLLVSEYTSADIDYVYEINGFAAKTSTVAKAALYSESNDHKYITISKMGTGYSIKMHDPLGDGTDYYLKSTGNKNLTITDTETQWSISYNADKLFVSLICSTSNDSSIMCYNINSPRFAPYSSFTGPSTGFGAIQLYEYSLGGAIAGGEYTYGPFFAEKTDSGITLITPSEKTLYINSYDGNIYGYDTDLKSLYTIYSNIVPTPPATDGNYTLKCTILNGAVTYSWE